MPTLKALVLYHDNCPDGFTAAWAVWRSLGGSAEYVGVNYGQEPPVERARDRDVYLVDFSYPRAALDRLADAARSVTIFDHHKTAQADLADWPRGRVVFDMERSGASVAWDEMNPGGATWQGIRPRIVAYAEDMDLWRFALPHAREIREVIFLAERTFAAWDALNERLTVDLDGAVAVGVALLQAKKVRVRQVCENARFIVLAGHRIPIVNTAWDMSEIGEHLCEKFPEAPCGGYYFDRADKRQWGFRSRGGFDVSALCRQYGGGGHKTAAGFTAEIGWLPDDRTV